MSCLLAKLRILGEHHPEDPGELTGDGDDGLLRALAPSYRQVEIAPVKALVRAVGQRNDRCRLPDFVIPPSRRELPLECSLGTRPRYDISFRGDRKRTTS